MSTITKLSMTIAALALSAGTVPTLAQPTEPVRNIVLVHGAFADADGRWFRSYGNENWEFAANGLMQHRIASINDLPIEEGARLFHWSQGRRPDDHPGLSDLGL